MVGIALVVGEVPFDIVELRKQLVRPVKVTQLDWKPEVVSSLSGCIANDPNDGEPLALTEVHGFKPRARG